jgi:predicted ATP-dependent endonuclease of OLD family
MQLCYIWIEEYKGFVDQGFNFSSKNSFEYDKYKSHLSKSKISTFIPDFFSSDIAEITGVIGKNASGKTNILELIQYVIDGANTIVNKPFLAIFENNGKYKVYNYKLPHIENNFSASIENYDGKVLGVNSIFFSNVFDGRRHNFGKKIIDISTNDLLNSQFGENINKNYQKQIQQQIHFIKSKEFELLENIENEVNSGRNIKLKPSKVILTSPIWSNIINRVKSLDEKIKKERELNFQLKEFVLSFRKKITDNKSLNSIKYFSSFLVFIDFVLNRDILKMQDGKGYSNKEDYYKILNNIFDKTQEDLRIDEMYKYFIGDFAINIDKYFNVFETHKFLVELNERDFGNQSDPDFKEDVGTYASRRVQFKLDYNDQVGSFLTAYLEAVTNQSLTLSVEWSGISSGHKAYINLFANFHSALKRVKEDNVIICIDEGDLYFHPKWQTEFLYKLIKVLPKLINKRCQLVLTTHSPFLISDLPKSNLLFLEKSASDNLKVISNIEIEGETFGGNIGDLYLDAFFMNGGLISYFAASKIQSLVKKINERIEPISNDDRTLINQIGDELIKLQINKLINDKN